MASTTSNRTLATCLLNVNRFVFLVIVGIVAVGLDIMGLSLFDINTISQAVQTFFVLVVGGYIGFTAVDSVWYLIFGT